ncbi:hypothetical protein F511_18010 [Dorcoceras hygrometricum]|uniref:Uncharacterized protein n=1 Tax=Dorcoceras hygrometricum TaxID=472368 RepID=A0A2Z7DAV2_9LAMI|nr:hypothetical protein F511_18010 [Dorcoceras hygrometricum]
MIGASLDPFADSLGVIRRWDWSTGCVLGKWVCLVTLAMSLFDLQVVCIAVGSLATLDLPMVVDMMGIYMLKGPYCTLTTTNWFLQALSVIPSGSWGDVARRFTMIRWASPKFLQLYNRPTPPSPTLPSTAALRRPLPPSCAAFYVIGLVSITTTRIFHPCQNPSDPLLQIDGGILIPVVDLIDDLPPPTVLSAGFLVKLVGARRLDASNVTIR